MLLGVGTRVKFLRTPDAGKVTARLGDGMVMVLLDDIDMEIPAFEEDLVREETYHDNQAFQKMKEEYPHLAKQAQKEKTPPLSILPSNTVFKPNLTDSGVQIGLLPIRKNNDEIEKFEVWLLNDTAYDILLEFDLVIFGDVVWSKDEKLKAISSEKLGDMLFDEVNDLPEFDVAISPITTEGVGEKLTKTLKIKPKQLFKPPIFSSFLNREVYLFPVFENIVPKEEGQNSTQDLKKYTSDILKVKKIEQKKQEAAHSYNPVSDVNEYATFVNEIDLHIELLHDNPSTLNNTEIINIQLRAFETFLYKAIRLGVRRVFVIHGVGKGRLKEMIHARLRRHSDIEYFKNEYHERYGWGATEVFL